MTPSIRRRIYTAASGLLGVLVVIGLLAGDEAPLWLAVVDAGVALVVAVLALRNLNRDTWAVFRGACFALLAAAGPALATLGIRLDERWPATVSQLLTIAAAVLAVSNIDDETPAIPPPP
jgi:hypothetical protein